MRVGRSRSVFQSALRGEQVLWTPGCHGVKRFPPLWRSDGAAFSVPASRVMKPDWHKHGPSGPVL